MGGSYLLAHRICGWGVNEDMMVLQMLLCPIPKKQTRKKTTTSVLQVHILYPAMSFFLRKNKVPR